MIVGEANYRICHLSKYYPPVPGGIETHIQTLARAQTRLGAKVNVLCVNCLNPKSHSSFWTTTTKRVDQGVEVTSIRRLGSLGRLDLCPHLLKHLWQSIDQSYDVLHIHTPNPTMLLAWIAIRPQISLVITHHSDVIKQRFLKYFLRPIEHLVYRQAAHVLTDSPNYIEGSKFLQLYRHNLKALPLGLDCSTYRHPTTRALAYRHYLRGTYGKPIWLAAGRLVYYKALHVAIQALAFVPGTLIIIGTGPLEPKLRVLAQQLGLEHRIVWHGYASSDELVGAYHAATALWFPSNARSEGFGLVQVEAMASGCPVINSAIPGSGVAWVSRHEKEGLTVPLNDPRALAQAAQRLLNEPGLRHRLATGSRKRAFNEFDHMAMAHQSLDIYAQAIKSTLPKATVYDAGVTL